MILLVPAVAVTLPVQVPVNPLGLAMVNAPGKVSTSEEVNVAAEALVLPNVIVKADIAPILTAAGLNDFATVGGFKTVNVAEA